MTSDIPVITIDGPSGSGKGTISLLLAKKLGWHFLDSGAIYRVLAYVALQQSVNDSDVPRLTNLAENLPLYFKEDIKHTVTLVFLNDKNISNEIRDENVGMMASKIAAHQSVRAALLQRQRDFQKSPGLVTDGRDMGTVVFPHAGFKFYLLASVEERAMRRFNQLQKKGELVSYDEILTDLSARDAWDQSRKVAPLKPADDAIVIDTTHLTIEEVLQRVLQEMDY